MSETLARPFRPMLAAPFDPALARWPLLASAKLDGIRATVHGGVLYSRSMKPIPNRFVQAWAWQHRDRLEGADGELIVGAPNEADTFRRSTSFVMSDDKADFAFTFYAFDLHDLEDDYRRRYDALHLRVASVPRVSVVPQIPVSCIEDLEPVEERMLARGFEGIMLRDPRTLYKQGRATARSGELLKVKRHEDMEAEVIGFEELMHNGNEAFTNEIGRTSRSSHQENKVGSDTLGALTVRGLNGRFQGVEFSVGTGFDAEDRARVWRERPRYLGLTAKVKFFPIGSKDRPRHPVFAGWRDARDTGE